MRDDPLRKGAGKEELMPPLFGRFLHWCGGCLILADQPLLSGLPRRAAIRRSIPNTLSWKMLKVRVLHKTRR